MFRKFLEYELIPLFSKNFSQITPPRFYICNMLTISNLYNHAKR